MITTPLQSIVVRQDRDISVVRRAVSTHAERLNLSVLSRTRLVTASSELTRNMLVYGGGGVVELKVYRDGERLGLGATFADQGPGIDNVEDALADGFTSGVGLGLGLGGARRLVDQFDIQSSEVTGTSISVAIWLKDDGR